MAQQDRDHNIVVQALKAAGWTVTHEKGIFIKLDDKRGLIDIGAEIYVAEKGLRKIAVEVKNYPGSGDGVMGDFDRSIGQYLRYRECLADDEPDRQIIKAVPNATYDEFLSKPQTAAYLRRYDVKLLVYNPSSKTIDKWIE